MILSCKTGKMKRICEAALLYAIGYIDTRNASDAHPQWRLLKAKKLKKITPAEIKQEMAKNSRGLKETTQFLHAKSYIIELSK